MTEDNITQIIEEHIKKGEEISSEIGMSLQSSSKYFKLPPLDEWKKDFEGYRYDIFYWESVYESLKEKSKNKPKEEKPQIVKDPKKEKNVYYSTDLHRQFNSNATTNPKKNQTEIPWLAEDAITPIQKRIILAKNKISWKKWMISGTAFALYTLGYFSNINDITRDNLASPHKPTQHTTREHTVKKIEMPTPQIPATKKDYTLERINLEKEISQLNAGLRKEKNEAELYRKAISNLPKPKESLEMSKMLEQKRSLSEGKIRNLEKELKKYSFMENQLIEQIQQLNSKRPDPKKERITYENGLRIMIPADATGIFPEHEKEDFNKNMTSIQGKYLGIKSSIIKVSQELGKERETLKDITEQYQKNQNITQKYNKEMIYANEKLAPLIYGIQQKETKINTLTENLEKIIKKTEHKEVHTENSSYDSNSYNIKSDNFLVSHVPSFISERTYSGNVTNMISSHMRNNSETIPLARLDYVLKGSDETIWKWDDRNKELLTTLNRYEFGNDVLVSLKKVLEKNKSFMKNESSRQVISYIDSRIA